MERLTGLLGLVVILLLAWLMSTNRKAIRWQTAAWGLGLQWIFALLVLRLNAGERALAAAGSAVNQDAGLRLHRLRLCFRRAGETALFVRARHRVPGAAHHHLYLRLLRRSVPPGHHAGGHQGHGLVDASDHAHQWRGVAQRRGQHLHGANGSAAQHPSLPAGRHTVRTHDHHDQWHGPRVRRHHGCLYPCTASRQSICWRPSS